MSYIEGITAADSASTDAFGRWRTSDTGQRLDVEFLYNKQDEYFDEITNGASATVTFNGGGRDLTLDVNSTTNGEYACMRSYPVPYTPGNSQLIDITGVLDLTGIGGGTAQIFVRSNVTGSAVETVTDQSSWIAATSGVDWTDSHIFQMDFQSLKVGRIRFNLVQNGLPVNVLTINNDNVRNVGYWQIANGSVYWRIYNDATYTYMEIGYGNENNAIGFRYKITANATATMKAICCTVKSEGGLDLRNLPGLPRSINNGVTSVTASTTRVPILSIRPKTTFLTYENLILAIPKSFGISTDQDIRVDIMHDVTLTNATTPTWADVDSTESMMEYCVDATGTTNGHVVYSEYFTGGSGKSQQVSANGILGKTVLWDRQGSETGILTIAAVRTSTSDASVFASLNWEELR